MGLAWQDLHQLLQPADHERLELLCSYLQAIAPELSQVYQKPAPEHVAICSQLTLNEAVTKNVSSQQEDHPSHLPAI